MRPTIVIIDDFLENAADARRRLLSGEAVVWTDSCLGHLGGLFGGRRLLASCSLFRLGKKDDDHRSFIHADNVAGAQYAGILYLSHPDPRMNQQGTAFWRHRRLGVDRIPAGVEQLPWLASNAREVIADAPDPAKWDLLGNIPLRFNRFVAFDVNLFHSRWPQQMTAETNEAARLVWVVFFRAEETIVSRPPRSSPFRRASYRGRSACSRF